jgi:amino-acid N-acetyltransferase
MEDVATRTAIALDADKLIFLTETDGIPDGKGGILGELSEDEARRLLASGTLDPANEYYLRHAVQACEGGVARAHIVPFRIDGSLLLELFQHNGVGSMLVEETLEALRDATIDDVGGILAVIRPLEEEGILAPRDHAQIERDVEKFIVIEHDGVIFGCAALYAYEGQDIAEMACLAVSGQAQGQGDGERLLRRIEQRARGMGIRRLFVLTTRTMHWFLKRGFVEASIDDLPPNRRDMYNWQRRSKVLIKNL